MAAVETTVFHPPVELRYPDRDRGPYRLRLWVGLLEDRPVVARIEVSGFDDDPFTGIEPITSSTIRLPLQELLREAVKNLSDEIEAAAAKPSAFGWPWHLAELEPTRDALHNEPKVGRPRVRDDEHFVEVATVYRDAMVRGDFPTVAVSKHFHVSKTCAAKWVSRARALGLLPPTEQGRANAGRRLSDE